MIRYRHLCKRVHAGSPALTAALDAVRLLTKARTRTAMRTAAERLVDALELAKQAEQGMDEG